MSPVLILTAAELEARALARALGIPRLRSFPFPVFGRPGLRLSPVGVGAGLCDARWPLLAAGMDGAVVVSAGVCGGLDPRLRPGDLVIPECVIGPSGARHAVSADAHRHAVSAAGAPSPCTAPLVTAGRVAATPADKAALRAESGAAAVDMESAPLVARAAGAACSAVVVRAVVDDAGQGLPAGLLGLVRPDGRLRPGRAAAALLGDPRLLREAIRLRRETGRALAAVARVLVGAGWR